MASDVQLGTIEAARKELEDIATPLTAQEAKGEIRGEAAGYEEILMAPPGHDRTDFWLEREIEQLERALADRGELRRRDLGNAVGCKYWGPGRFRQALSAAVDQGRISRVGFGRYAPADRPAS